MRFIFGKSRAKTNLPSTASEAAADSGDVEKLPKEKSKTTWGFWLFMLIAAGAAQNARQDQNRSPIPRRPLRSNFTINDLPSHKVDSKARNRETIVQTSLPPTVSTPELATKQEPVQQTPSSTRTAEYWEVAVANQYLLRFDDPAVGKSAADVLNESIAELRAAVAKINSIETANVDQQLVEMARKHAASDLVLVKTMSELLNHSASDGVAVEGETSEESIRQAYELLNNLQFDPSILDQIPNKEVRQTMSKLVGLLDINGDAFQETAVMQARLEERYRDVTFDLPKLQSLRLADPSSASKTASAQNAFRKRLALPANQIKTEAFWKEMVAAFHVPRFAFDETKEAETDFVDLLVFKLRPAIRNMNPTSVDYVDSDLVTMAERHLSADIALIEHWEFAEHIATKYAVTVDRSTIVKEALWMNQVLEHIVEDDSLETENADQETLLFANRLVELKELRNENYLEIEVMQARMQERYRSKAFTLPNPAR